MANFCENLALFFGFGRGRLCGGFGPCFAIEPPNLDNSVNQLNVSQVLDYRSSNKTVVSCDRQPHRDRVGATQKQKQYKNTPQNKTQQETPKKIKNHNKKTQKAARRATWRRLRRRGVATAFFCALFFGFSVFSGVSVLFCFGGYFCIVFVF